MILFPSSSLEYFKYPTARDRPRSKARGRGALPQGQAALCAACPYNTAISYKGVKCEGDTVTQLCAAPGAAGARCARGGGPPVRRRLSKLCAWG